MKVNIVKIILLLAIIVPFSNLIAPYSLFYIPYIEVFSYATLFAVLMLFLPITKSMVNINGRKNILIFLLVNVFVLAIPVVFHGQSPFVNDITGLMFIVFFVVLHAKYRLWIYDKFVNILALIFLAGIIEVLVFRYTGFYVSLGEVNRVTSQGDWSAIQGLFNIFPVYFDSGSFRFQSLMDEPGRVGTICSFLLFTTNFKQYKKQFIIFVIAGIISLSLAFYIFFTLFLLVKLVQSNTKSIIIGSLMCCLALGLFYGKIETFVIDRIDENEHVDNRTSYQFNQELKTYNNSNEIFFGKGNRTIEQRNWGGGNAGIKVKYYQFGIVGVTLMLLSFSFLFLNFNGISLASLVVLGVFMLSFYQRADWNFTPNTIILFAYNLPLLYHSQKTQTV